MKRTENPNEMDNVIYPIQQHLPGKDVDMQIMNDFVQIPSTFPVEEPVMLVINGQQVVFNKVIDNGYKNGIELVLETYPYSLVADDLEMSDEAKQFFDKLRN